MFSDCGMKIVISWGLALMLLGYATTEFIFMLDVLKVAHTAVVKGLYMHLKLLSLHIHSENWSCILFKACWLSLYIYVCVYVCFGWWGD